MADSSNDTQSNIIDIAADGDLILVVGPEKMSLHVHSLFLKSSSKFFAALLGPNWKEGQKTIGQDGPTKVQLPEGDSAALRIICAIIHHRISLMPWNLAASKVFEVAVAADEYDCIGVLKFASEVWFYRGIKTTFAHLLYFTAAAYLFKNAKAFKELTKTLVLEYNGLYYGPLSERLESVMPWRVFCKCLVISVDRLSKQLIGHYVALLGEQRSCARASLTNILLGARHGATCPKHCGWASSYQSAYCNFSNVRVFGRCNHNCSLLQWETREFCLSQL